MATLDGGIKMWFESTSGQGGATGSWAPVPDDIVEGIGNMEYPPGQRSWPIALPMDTGQDDHLHIPITCNRTGVVLAASFTSERR